MDWGLILTTLTVIGIVGGAVGGVIPVIDTWTRIRPPLKVKRILEPEDPDLLGLWELHCRFDESVTDELDDLKFWVSEVDYNFSRDDEYRCDDILCVLKERGDVVGYLYAQHYIKRRFIFISYLAIDKSSLEAKHKGADKLLLWLMTHCDKQKIGWEYIISEVEEEKGENRQNARNLMRTFQIAMSRLEKALRSRAKPRVFRLCFNYIQPILRPDELESNVPEQSRRQWLLYVPRSEGSLASDGPGNIVIGKQKVLGILENVLIYLYGGAFEGSEPYQGYLRDELLRYESMIQGEVRLVDSRTAARLRPGE